MMIALLLCETVAADCTVAIEEGSSLIRQGEARSIGAGTRCDTESSYCTLDQTGTYSFVAANHTIAGGEASGGKYDEFFEAICDATQPLQLFAASSMMEIRQWAVGVVDESLIDYSSWAPFMVSRIKRSTDDIP